MKEGQDSQPTDDEIASKWERDPVAGFTVFYETYGSRVMGAIRNRSTLFDPADVLQAASVRALEGFGTWLTIRKSGIEHQTLEQWLLVLAKRSLDCLRRADHRTKRWSQEPSWEPPDRDKDDDPVVACLHEAIATLTPIQRGVIEADMRCVSGKADTASLADVLGISRGTIYTHRCDAHRGIREYMTGKGCFTLDCEVIHDV
jgi:DNA-directed RNA polymerase specialized sigma24 family protein